MTSERSKRRDFLSLICNGIIFIINIPFPFLSFLHIVVVVVVAVVVFN